MSRTDSSDAEAFAGLAAVVLVLLVVAVTVIVYATVLFVMNTWRIYARFSGTREGTWLWYALAALGLALVTALLLAQLAPVVALWLASAAFGAWAVLMVTTDIVAGPDTRYLGSGDLLAPWKPVTRAT